MRQGPGSFSSCILRNLDNPLLNGIALGLELGKDQALTASRDMFPCCKGESYAWHPESRAVERCALHARIAKLQTLLNDFRAAWPQAPRLPQQIPPAFGHQILEELAGVFRHDRPQATIAFSSQKQQPSLLWSKAFAAVWRYGKDVRIRRWEAFDASVVTALSAGGQRPAAIFLEQVDKLWDPQNVENFEFIVQQTYNSGYPIWIEFVQEDGTSAAADNTLRSQLARKIQKLKNRNPLELLSQDCLSRLRSMSGLRLQTNDGAKTNA